MNAKELYLQNQNTIKAKARYFARYHPQIDADELESRANLVFMECLGKNTKASFSTYFSKALDRDLRKYLNFFLLDWEELRDVFLCDQGIEQQSNFPYWLHSLSENSQRIINGILHCPNMRLESQKTNKITKQSLRDFYHKKFGWKLTDIQNCFNEIEVALERF